MSDQTLPFVSRKQLSFSENSSFELIINSKTDTAKTLTISGATKDGVFSFIHTTTAYTQTIEQSYSLPDAPIWVTASDASNLIDTNEIYIKISLGINKNKIFCLLSGYLSGLRRLSWSNSSLHDTILLPSGKLTTVAVTAPNPGAELSWSIQGIIKWKLKALSAVFNAGAAVVNRKVQFVLASANNFKLYSEQSPIISAGQSITVSLCHHPIAHTLINNDTIIIPFPDEIYLQENDILSTVTENLNANDQYTSVKAYVEAWQR